jgi:hypothetical protein
MAATRSAFEGWSERNAGGSLPPVTGAVEQPG